MNDNLRKYIESIDNTVWLYVDILNNKILEDENLKNIDDEAKKELFDYIFDKYLDSQNELNFLSINSLYYGFFTLEGLKIFSSIEEHCRNKIKDTLSEKEKEIKINPNIRNIFMHLDMALFIGEENLLREIKFSQYLQTIADKIKDINYGNAQFYTKSVQLIFIIKLLIGKINAKNDIDEILNVIKKFDEYGQYNILEYIICSLEYIDKDKIKDNLIYDNLIKYSIELFNEDKLRKNHSYNKRITYTLKYIIDNLSGNDERLKYILDIYFSKDEKVLKNIYEYIDYEERHMLDIPIYCLLKLKESNNNIKEILSPAQYNLIICYLALNVRKDKKIIIKDINEEEIDLSIYWDLVREEFIEICNNYEMKKYGFIFLQKYIGILQALYPTVKGKEFNKFSEEMKNFFYYHLIKEDNKELYKLIPEEVKRQFEIDKRYKEKIEEEEKLFQKERVECIHKLFDKDKIIGDIKKIVEVLGDTPTFYYLSSYNNEFHKGKFNNKEKFIEEMDTNERLIVNPFIIDYFLIVSRYFKKYIYMNKIEEYINNYWDKHWGIHLYNYLKQNRDIKDKVSFNEEEKEKIKNYFNSENYGKVIEDLHNCLEGTFDNSYLYFIYYDIENIFKGIEFGYNEEILVNMLKIPYYYYKGDIKLYNDYYYLEYAGIIVEGDDDKINFENFFRGNKELKKSVLGKLIKTINKYRITDKFGSYYTLKSIIKLYNSDKENCSEYYDDIMRLVSYYRLSLSNKKKKEKTSNE